MQAARKALKDLKKAAAAYQPYSAARELAGSSKLKEMASNRSDSSFYKISRSRQLKRLKDALPGLEPDMREWTKQTRIKVRGGRVAG